MSNPLVVELKCRDLFDPVDVLTDLVELYEAKHVQMGYPSPVAANDDSDGRLKAAEDRIAALRTQLAKFAPGWQDAADALRADDDAARVSLLPPTDESKLARQP